MHALGNWLSLLSKMLSTRYTYSHLTSPDAVRYIFRHFDTASLHILSATDWQAGTGEGSSQHTWSAAVMQCRGTHHAQQQSLATSNCVPPRRRSRAMRPVRSQDAFAAVPSSLQPVSIV